MVTNEQLELLEFLCKKLKAHSINLVYTPCNRNITNPNVHAVWLPWQVIAHGVDESKTFFRFNKTAEGAISSAMKEI